MKRETEKLIRYAENYSVGPQRLRETITRSEASATPTIDQILEAAEYPLLDQILTAPLPEPEPLPEKILFQSTIFGDDSDYTAAREISTVKLTDTARTNMLLRAWKEFRMEYDSFTRIDEFTEEVKQFWRAADVDPQYHPATSGYICVCLCPSCHVGPFIEVPRI